VRQMGFQEISSIDLAKSITKYVTLVTDPASIRYHLSKAVFIARTGRPGPVWVDIPLDIQAAMIDETTLNDFDPKELEVHTTHPAAQEINKIIELLNRSERPVILAGNGIRLAGALQDFLHMVNALQIPVLTTWKAIDFLPESHSLFCGRPGAIGQRGANFTQQNADCLLVIGARLDYGQTGYNHKNFARQAKKIMVDIDPAEINKMMTPIDVPIAADAKIFIAELMKRINSLTPKDRSGWLARCKKCHIDFPVVLSDYWKEQGFVNNYVLVDVLSEEMSPDDLLIPGSSGASSEITMQAFRVKEGMRVFNTEGLGSMGFGVPAAIGGCIASGGKRTVCIDGDGGFHMNSQELETIRRLDLPLKIFVLNNNGYGSMRTTQRNYFKGNFVGSNPESGLTLPNIMKLGEAYGLKTRLLRDHTDLSQKVREILQTEGPVLVEVMISPEQMTMPKLSSMQRPDGSMVSKPLEDLWPFLSRDEFRANMIIPPLNED